MARVTFSPWGEGGKERERKRERERERRGEEGAYRRGIEIANRAERRRQPFQVNSIN